MVMFRGATVALALVVVGSCGGSDDVSREADPAGGASVASIDSAAAQPTNGGADTIRDAGDVGATDASTSAVDPAGV